MMDRERDPTEDRGEDPHDGYDCDLGGRSSLYATTTFPSASCTRQEVIVLDSDSDRDDDGDGSCGGNRISTSYWPAHTLTLPIEGVLLSPDATHPALSIHDHKYDCKSSDDVGRGGRSKEEEEERKQTSLWTPLFALRIPSSDPLGNSSAAAANYYSPQDIAHIISTATATSTSQQRQGQRQQRRDDPTQQKQQENGGEGCVRLLWWNRYTQRVSCSPPPRLAPCRGGILADQM